MLSTGEVITSPTRVRHVKLSKNKGGTLARLSPQDGPPRKIQVKEASEAVVIWVAEGKPLQLSIRWPAIFGKLGVERFIPAVPEGATVLATWKRHKMIWLDEATGQPPGFYRVKEFDAGQVTVLPENAVTDEVARRLGLKAGKKRAARPPEPAPDAEQEKKRTGQGAENQAAIRTKEIKLGKKVLAAYFRSLGGGQ